MRHTQTWGITVEDNHPIGENHLFGGRGNHLGGNKTQKAMIIIITIIITTTTTIK